jgi:hypothetical protein
MLKHLFRRSTESLPGDIGQALRFWKEAHVVGFTYAMSIVIFGLVLKHWERIASRQETGLLIQ